MHRAQRSPRNASELSRASSARPAATERGGPWAALSCWRGSEAPPRRPRRAASPSPPPDRRRGATRRRSYYSRESPRDAKILESSSSAVEVRLDRETHHVRAEQVALLDARGVGRGHEHRDVGEVGARAAL